MADALALPDSAFSGDWLGEGVAESSESATFCFEIFERLRSARSVWLGNQVNPSSSPQCDSSTPSIFVRTGGTSGKPRFARHTWQTMSSAVRGLRRVLGDEPMSSFCCLPLDHVGGWMQVVRAIETGGDLIFGHYLELAEPERALCLRDRMVSLVPTQLHRLLSYESAVSRLQQSRVILLGGSPLSDDLAQKAREAKLPLAPTYGMTETAGTITVLPPNEFLAGESGVGSVLPHLLLRLDPRSGTLSVRGESLCLVYVDKDFSHGEWLVTSDLAEQTKAGHWRILGRTDRVVNTGGEKVDPLVLEDFLKGAGLVDDCIVLGMPDTDWGQRLVTYCSPESLNPEDIKNTLAQRFSGAMMPKKIFSVRNLPLNAMGKPDYELAKILAED